MSSPTSEELSPSPTKQAGRASFDSAVGHVRPSHASKARIDVPQLKNFRAFPGPLYFLSYANTADLFLYALGSFLALLCALPFSGIDILYGRWASGLVNLNPDGSPPTPDYIRSISDRFAYIGIGITFGMWITTGGFFLCMSLASSRVVARMRRAYLAAILAQDATYFEQIGPGEVASRLNRDLEMVRMGCGEKLGFILWSVSGLICGVTVSFSAAPRVGGVLFSILPFAGLIFVVSGFVSTKAASRMATSEGEAASFLEQLLSSIRIVKVFQASKPLVGVYDGHLEKIQKDSRFIAFSKGLTYAGSYHAIFICYALAFWYGGKQVAWHGLDTGKLITAFFSMFNAMFAIVNILPHITAFSDALQAQARIRIEIERVSRIDHRRKEGVSSFPSLADKSSGDEERGLTIELKSVSFAFPSRLNHKSLDDVSLTIPAGKVVALVGASGSGKSTVTALLLRQFDLPNPDSLTHNVFINSQPVASIQIAFLRSQIAIVAQDPQLTSSSILENVAVGLTGTANELKADRSNLDEVEALCKIALEHAQAWSFVQRLPQGVHTVVSGGKTGVLSGGQRQRIAIARAIIRRPKILLMDEATSALDSQTEGRLQKAIAAEQKARGMTVVLIAHRLSTVRDADKIVVMGSGRKLEEGTHAELVALNGAYATMLQRHHGVVPGDDSICKEEEENMLSNSSAITDYSPPTAHNLQQATDVVPIPHHLPPSTLRQTSEIFRPTSRPGARAGYSFGLQQAEEAQASVDKAEADSKTTARGQWVRFFGYVGEQRRWIIPGVCCSALIGASFPSSGYLTGAVVHALSGPVPSEVAKSSARYALYFLVIALANLILCFSEGWFLENGAQRLTRRMRKTATEAILRQEVGWFDDEKNGSGGLSASIASHPSVVAVATGLISGRLVVALVNLLGSMIVAFILSWDVALVGFSPLLILVPVAVLEVTFFGKYETECERPTVAATSYATENIDAVKTVAAYGRERQVVEEFDRLQQPDVKAHRNSLALGSFFFGLGQASFPLLVVLVFWYGGDKFAKGQISITNLFAVFEMAFIGAFSVGKAFGFIGDISRAFHSFRSFSKWIERLPLVAKLDSLAKSRPLPTLSEKSGGADIIFSKVQLVYPTRPERPAIHALDLHIKAGEKVAFCGPSGGGKSSILALLARFYESSRGVITVDGEDIRAADLKDHYERISLVSQDAVLYEGTVAFNLTLGLNREVSETELREACRDACILDFVESLPGGFEASIGLKGMSMSGGQRQRICIARALLRNAQILLLDEATSALDNESEALVQQAIDRASIGRTTLTVAHRLSTIRNADRIYVLEDGRVKEAGTHDELVRKNGRYVELVEAQL